MKVPPRDSPAWQTPVYLQYWALKDQLASQNPNDSAFMFFRLGDFYELFGDDAVRASPLLEVQLTSRDRSQEPIPMCGIPYHAWESYAEKILSRGHKIAIVDQVEEAGAGKKLVDRQIQRILTPGLPIDPTKMSAKENHYLLALSHDPESGGVELRALDFLGRHLFAGVLKTSEEFNDLILSLNPKEILVSTEIDLEEPFFAFIVNHYFNKITNWSRGGVDSILKDYLCYTQRWSLQELESYWPTPESLAQFRSSKFAQCSRQVLEQWDIYPHLADLFDECASATGSRRLRQILSQALFDSKIIQQRQNFLKELPYKEVLEICSHLYDLERLLGRILIRAAKPYELIRVKHSLAALQKISLLFDSYPQLLKSFNELCHLEEWPLWNSNRELLDQLANTFAKYLKDDAQGADCRSLIQLGSSDRFDELQSMYSNFETWLSEYEAKLKTETSIPSLKVRYNRVAGFYIEVSKSYTSKVPSTFERRQTLVNAERYTENSLKEKESLILNAEDSLEKEAQSIIDSLELMLKTNSKALQDILFLASHLDAFSGALKAIQKCQQFGAWNWPSVREGDFYFDIREGRHPLVEFQEKTFTSNSLSLGCTKKRILLLTGPNMAGKSTLMRQCGVILLLAQMGLKVPAESCELSPARGFYSRMGASDKILMGESTFMVEMRETAYILREADRNSFVLIDEVGRGTSTHDGLAIAKAILEYLATEKTPLTIFATHYHELSPFSERFEVLVNGSMSIREWKNELIFLRKLVMEAASSSHGLHVAKLAGIPTKILARAKKFHSDESTVLVNTNATLSLFDQEKTENKDDLESSLIHQKLESLDIDNLSPRQAWTLLDELKKQL